MNGGRKLWRQYYCQNEKENFKGEAVGKRIYLDIYSNKLQLCKFQGFAEILLNLKCMCSEEFYF